MITSFRVYEGETASRGKLTTRIMFNKTDRTVFFFIYKGGLMLCFFLYSFHVLDTLPIPPKKHASSKKSKDVSEK